jgi:hypothetical protein
MLMTFRPGKKWDLWILRNICLSNKIEKHLKFFTRTLRENFKESYLAGYLPFESILRLRTVLHILHVNRIWRLFCFLSHFTTNIIEEHLKKANSGSEEHWTLFPGLMTLIFSLAW